MNLSHSSAKSVRERGGSAAEDRPEHTDEALAQVVRVGFGNGLAVVEPDDGYSAVQLGESGDYSHYPNEDQLFAPETGGFLVSLFESDEIGGLADASEETSIGRQTLKEASELHGIDYDTDASADTETSSDASDDGQIRLPSGEKWNTTHLARPVYTDSRLLTQLLATDGMSIDEATRFLEEQLGNVDRSELEQACIDCGLLDGRRSTSDDREPDDIRLSATDGL